MEIFTWTPDTGQRASHEPRRRVVKFGDAYEQVSPDGLNPDMATFQGLSFSGRSLVEAQAIYDFLKARGGVEAFLWTPPRWSAQAKFRCAKYDMTPTDYGMVVTADFYQVPV